MSRITVTVYNDNETDGVDLQVVRLKGDGTTEAKVLHPSCGSQSTREFHDCFELRGDEIIVLKAMP